MGSEQEEFPANSFGKDITGRPRKTSRSTKALTAGTCSHKPVLALQQLGDASLHAAALAYYGNFAQCCTLPEDESCSSLLQTLSTSSPACLSWGSKVSALLCNSWGVISLDTPLISTLESQWWFLLCSPGLSFFTVPESLSNTDINKRGKERKEIKV